MLRLFTDLIDSLKGPSATRNDAATREHSLEMATAVLLIEVVRADGDIDGPELEAVTRVLQSRFTLAPSELDALIEVARHRSEHTHDLFSFTSRLNEALDERERIHVFELLWKVAYANGEADAHETHLLRKLADLLHLRHADAIGARLRAEAST